MEVDSVVAYLYRTDMFIDSEIWLTLGRCSVSIGSVRILAKHSATHFIT